MKINISAVLVVAALGVPVGGPWGCREAPANQPSPPPATPSPAALTSSTAPGAYLSRYFDNNDKRLMFKWRHYFEVYERHLARFRGQEVTIVEVGVFHGGSLQMWKDYLGPRARIIGIDIDERCKLVEEAQIEVRLGDQSDPKFWAKFREEFPKVDILLDDGGHTMEQQITTFKEMFPHLSSNGVFMTEDLHTSYWAKYGGGYRKAGTFIEMSKKLVDELNAWHSQGPESFKITPFTQTAHSLHFYGSILVIEKRPMTKPVAAQSGRKSF